jgi:hypothetical protein
MGALSPNQQISPLEFELILRKQPFAQATVYLVNAVPQLVGWEAFVSRCGFGIIHPFNQASR